MPALAKLIERDSLAGNPLVRRVLNANLRIGGEEEARALANFALRENAEERHRAEALKLLTRWGEPDPLDTVIGDWRPLEPRGTDDLSMLVARLARKGILESPPEVLKQWIDLATTGSVAEVKPILIEIIGNHERQGASRVRALNALEKLDTESFAAVLRPALLEQDIGLRAAAIEALSRIDIAEAHPLYQAILETGLIEERRTVYRALAAMPAPEAEQLLRTEYAGLMAKVLPAELHLDLLEALSSCRSESLRELPAKIRAARGGADSVMGPWIDCLIGGDAVEGERIFRTRAELDCASCHAPEKTGGYGPDLDGVGKRLPRRQICQSIVDPNGRIAPGFETERIVLEDGQTVTGRVIDEGPETITIQPRHGEKLIITISTISERGPDASPMVSHEFGKHLTRFEMRDLIEYLSQRQP
jgi:putative heme-binding domain-containing protein